MLDSIFFFQIRGRQKYSFPFEFITSSFFYWSTIVQYDWMVHEYCLYSTGMPIFWWTDSIPTFCNIWSYWGIYLKMKSDMLVAALFLLSIPVKSWTTLGANIPLRFFFCLGGMGIEIPEAVWFGYLLSLLRSLLLFIILSM